MTPELDPKTGYLPLGIHQAAWDEVADRFGGNSHRRRLIAGLLAACRNLASARCSFVLLNGSFVSAKALPDDYNGAWETTGVDPDRLDSVLLDFSNGRAAMKSKYFGDLFTAASFAQPGVLYRDFFQSDRNGVPKGIVQIDLRSLP